MYIAAAIISMVAAIRKSTPLAAFPPPSCPEKRHPES